MSAEQKWAYGTFPSEVDELFVSQEGVAFYLDAGQSKRDKQKESD